MKFEWTAAMCALVYFYRVSCTLIRLYTKSSFEQKNSAWCRCLLFIMPTTVWKGGNKRCFLSVRLSARPAFAYIANNSRTQRPSVAKFGMKVPHLRCDSHTSFKVKRSKIRVTDWGGGIPCRPANGNTACFCQFCVELGRVCSAVNYIFGT